MTPTPDFLSFAIRPPELAQTTTAGSGRASVVPGLTAGGSMVEIRFGFKDVKVSGAARNAELYVSGESDPSTDELSSLAARSEIAELLAGEEEAIYSEEDGSPL